MLFLILILIISEAGLILTHLGHFSLANLSALTIAFAGITFTIRKFTESRHSCQTTPEWSGKLVPAKAWSKNFLKQRLVPTKVGMDSRLRGNDRKQSSANFLQSKASFERKKILLFLPIAAIAGILFFQPYQYMDGGWDPGGYINTGVHIGRTGSVLYHDEVLAQANKSDKQILCGLIRNDGTGIKYPGLYIKNIQEGLIVPQFFHLYPVWIAIFYKLAGLNAVFYVNPFFALLSVILIFFIGERIGRNYGFLTAFLLAVNTIQIWNARFPTSEILAQFLLLSGFYLWMKYLDSKNGFLAFWAGLAIGEFLLVSITSLIIIPVIIIYLVFRTKWLVKNNIDHLPKAICLNKDIYFALPFFLALAHLIIQLCTFSSIYFESVVMFFGRKEIYLCAGAFLLALACIPFLRRLVRNKFVLKKYLRVFLALAIASAFAYNYLIRPNVVSSIEALNLVELGRYISPVGLILAVTGLVFLIFREEREDILFFVITGIIAAVFFIYNKRMFSRYPFAMRRYIPMVIPVYCFCISYFCSSIVKHNVFNPMNRAATSVWQSVVASFLKLNLAHFRCKLVAVGIIILLVAVIPLKNCRDIMLARDHHGSLDFWKGFAGQMDDNAIYISNNYRWARPLTDIFGKNVLTFTGARKFGGEKIAKFAKKLIEDGKEVYYISDLQTPYSLSVDYVQSHKKSFKTEYLENTLTFPPVVKPLNLCFTVFSVIPIEKSEVPETGEYMIDIGAGKMGLLSGFDKARKFSGIPEYARWTFEKAELVIPWFGDNIAQTLTMFASGMPEKAGSTLVSLYIENFPILKNYPVGENLKQHKIIIPAGTVKTGNKKRVVLTIKSNVWDPSEYGIMGYPDKLGIKLYWIKIRTIR